MKQPPPPTQWRQRAPYAFVSRVSLSAQVFEALLGSHTGSPGARGAAAAGALEGARAQNTEGRSQRVTTPAHIPSTPTSSSPPDPSAQFPVALFGHFPRRAAAKAGRAGVPPQPVTAEEKPHAPGLAQPAALWSQGWSAAWDKHARALAQATAPGHCSMFGCQRTAFRNG